MSRSQRTIVVCAVCVFSLAFLHRLSAQESAIEVKRREFLEKAAATGQVPPGVPPQAGQPPKEGEKPGAPGATPGKTDAKPGEKAAEPARPRRKPKDAANPDELKVRPGTDGRVSFTFKGQDWEDVLEWLADISDMSLQMEEVPTGFLNLTSRGRYTVEKVQDLFNSALINKGYTLLRNGEVLLVSKLDKLDKSLVPRVDPEDLDQRGTYEFVKCFFDLNALVADNIAAELQPMLSPHGKITALKTTNRLDIVETGGNMRRIRDFLAEEQSDRGKENVLREFKLKFVRATEVYETLHTILGVKKPGPTVALTPEQIGQMQQQFMQAAQQAAQQAAKGAAGKQETSVFLAINKNENSILANAPADKMTIIEQAVKAMDIARNQSGSMLSNLPRLRSYKLSSVDPAALVKVLDDLGNLDPQTRLEVDMRSRSIIAFATPIDHVTIQAMVDKIDGTGRKFEVIQLYALDAEMVAGSIEFLMRGPQEKQGSNYNPFYYDFGYSSSRSRQPERDPSDVLQVEADTERNRLLIRATDSEMKEIRQLLAKLGELPEDDRGRQTMRVLPMSPGDMQKLIERIQNTWPSIAPNPLKISPVETPGEDSTEENGESPTRRPPALKKAGLDRSAPSQSQEPNEPSVARRPLALSSNRAPAADFELAISGNEQDLPVAQPDEPQEPPVPPLRRRLQRPETPPGSPPIAITPGPHGLVISSDDVEALDQLERIIGELVPTQRISSKLFYLKNSYCKDVSYVLEDIFKEDDGSRKPNPYFDDMYYYYRFGPGSRDSSKDRGRLSKRKKLKFIPETATNTILVQGADAGQLAEIERLIKIYDEGIKPDSNAVRETKRFSFQFTTAREVSEVIKDVYRDLLSPNDKAMAKNPQQQQQEQNKSLYSYTYIFGDTSKEDAIKFKGPISMGVDDRSNTLIVSARKDLMKVIGQLVDELDRSAQESRGVVNVLRLGNSIDPSQVQKALSGVGKAPSHSTNGQGPEVPAGKPQGQPIEPQVNRSYVYPQ